tara:strand:+ start:146 stop:349 length:204 start_codon:yes stop_codon:yes gene_type:complete
LGYALDSILPPIVIAQLYKCRWQVELFLKWIKQHLRIKAFYSTSENAVISTNCIPVYSQSYSQVSNL